MVSSKRLGPGLVGVAALAAVMTVRLEGTAGAAAPDTLPAYARMYIVAIDGKPYHSDQATVSVGQTITLALQVRFRSGATVDVSTNAGTTFITSPARGTFNSVNTWSPLVGDANKAFPIYGRYTNPISHSSIAS